MAGCIGLHWAGYIWVKIPNERPLSLFKYQRVNCNTLNTLPILFQRSAKDGGEGGGQGGIQFTGNLGDVMKESIQIAYTFAQVYLAEVDAENSFLTSNKVHLHVPEGATPKVSS